MTELRITIVMELPEDEIEHGRVLQELAPALVLLSRPGVKVTVDRLATSPA